MDGNNAKSRAVKMSRWTDKLNPEQVEAVLHDHGPMLILAGAGSGKTTVLVSRTGRLIEEQVARPDEIAVLTFTNKSAKELKERVAEKIGKNAKNIWAGTFHSFGVSVLKKHYKEAGLPQKFGIIDGGDSKAIVKKIIKDTHHYDKDNVNVDRLLSLISNWRESGQKKVRASDPDDPDLELVQVILPKYVKQLELLGVVDFDGLLLKPLEIFENHPGILKEYQDQIQHLMVDEFQDTNSIQMKLIHQLVKEHKNITVVGDDDQSIYGWRGAKVSNILNFPNRFESCRVVRLQRNYRSTSSILDIANTVIQKNTNRHDKVLKAEGYDHDGEKPELFVYESEEEEALEVVQQIYYFQRKGFSLKDIAILYRSNSQGGLLEGDLRRANIPYHITGGTAFFDRSEVKDVLAYIQCAFLGNEISLRRVINVPSRGIGEKTIHHFENYASDKKISFSRAIHTFKPEDHEKKYETLQDFLKAIESLKTALLQKNGSSCGENLLQFLDEIEYKKFVYSNFKDPKIAHKKWSVVEIFSRVLDGFINKNGLSAESIREFIEAMVLRDQMEESSNQKENDKIQLMTLHACKGLEFPVVLIVGCEEDIIPHKTLGLDIDEERRLFYVGLTRAKEHLVLTKASQRKRFGKLRPTVSSRFLLEIPEHLISCYEDGMRPLVEGERESMLESLYKKLEQNSKAPI